MEWITRRVSAVVQLIEGYTGDFYFVQSDLHNNQFVGRVPMGRDEFEDFLEVVDFEHCPKAALKSVNGETPERSWRETIDEDWQVHVVFYDGSELPVVGDHGYTYVYAHWEYRWDTHPWAHVRRVAVDGDTGVKHVKNLFDEYGLTHEPVRP